MRRNAMRNTSHTGEVCRTQLIALLTRKGKTVLLPLGDHLRYDLVVDDGGTFRRIQCKNGILSKGVITFDPCSVDSRSQPGKCIRKKYTGEVDLFGVYCPENEKCYLIPAEEVTSLRCYLRIETPRNGQKQGIKWAKDYEL
jgi:PD-(D/E)XK endonuclease